MFKHGHRAAARSALAVGLLPTAGQRPGYRDPDGAAGPDADLQLGLHRRGRRILQERGAEGLAPHPGRRRLAQRGDRGQRRLHHRHRAGVPARRGGGTAAVRHRQPDRPAAGRAGAAQGRGRRRRHHRQDAVRRARQGAEGQDHRHPGRRQHRACLGAAAWPAAAASTSRRTSASRRWTRPAMLPAMETKSVDGFATSLPFTTEAVVKGKAIMLASGAQRRARPAAVRLWADLHAARHVHQAARQVRAGRRARSPPPTSSSWRSRTRRWRS